MTQGPKPPSIGLVPTMHVILWQLDVLARLKDQNQKLKKAKRV